MKRLNKVFSFLYTEYTGAVALIAIALFFALIPRIYLASKNSETVNYQVDSISLLALNNKPNFNYENYTNEHYNNRHTIYLSSYAYKKFKYKKWQNNQSNSHFAGENKMYPRTNSNFGLKPFDINSADTNQFKKLKGIGSKLASRIIKYRDKLGGFYSNQQLKEVFGIDSLLINSQLSYLQIQTELTKININTCGQEQLAAHPYIGKYNAIKIINYRKFHMPLTETNMLKIGNIPADKIIKFMPYIQF